MSDLLQKIKDFFLHRWQVYDEAARQKAVDVLEAELGELENIFGLLVLGSFVGLPSPPMQISLDLLPEMEDLLHMESKPGCSTAGVGEEGGVRKECDGSKK